MNASVFWVTHNLINDWIQLPDAQPEHTVAAKNISRMMTGNLNAELDCNPAFPGKERHFLRAQLARIQHNCELCIKGEFEIDEETNEVKNTEEWAMPGTEELKSLEIWAHKHPIILNAGRCTHTEPEDMDEEAKEEYMTKLAEDDKTEERYRSIMEDSKVMKTQDAWISTTSGDLQPYNRVGGEGTVTYAINILRSTRWPGALTISKNGQYFFIYTGDAMRRGADFFNPIEPPEVNSDPSEPIEEPEPNGKDPVEKKVEEEEEDE